MTGTLTASPGKTRQNSISAADSPDWDTRDRIRSSALSTVTHSSHCEGFPRPAAVIMNFGDLRTNGALTGPVQHTEPVDLDHEKGRVPVLALGGLERIGLNDRVGEQLAGDLG
jgi:hypothetical protein